MFKRTLCVVLSVLMVLSFLAVPALAVPADVVGLTASSVLFADAGGTTITSLTAGEAVSATATVTNSSAAAKDAVIWVATYDNDAMISVSSQKTTIAAGASQLITVSTEAMPADVSNVKLKAQVWSSYSEMDTVVSTASFPSSDRTVLSFMVNGTALAGFSQTKNDYTIELPLTFTGQPAIGVTTKDNSTRVYVPYVNLPGTMPVEVVSADGGRDIYNLKFVYGPGNITNLTINPAKPKVVSSTEQVQIDPVPYNNLSALYTDRPMFTTAHVSSELKGGTRIMVPVKDMNRDSPPSEQQTFMTGNNEYFNFTVDAPGTVYVAWTAALSATNYSAAKGWTSVGYDPVMPAGIVNSAGAATTDWRYVPHTYEPSGVYYSRYQWSFSSEITAAKASGTNGTVRTPAIIGGVAGGNGSAIAGDDSVMYVSKGQYAYKKTFAKGEKVSIPVPGSWQNENIQVVVKWAPPTQVLSANADLSKLEYTVDGGSAALVPTFSAGTKGYNVTLPIGSASVSLAGTKADTGATVMDGAVLNTFPGSITSTVTAADGTVKTYKVNFNVAATTTPSPGNPPITPSIMASTELIFAAHAPDDKVHVSGKLTGVTAGKPVTLEILKPTKTQSDADANGTVTGGQNLFARIDSTVLAADGTYMFVFYLSDSCVTGDYDVYIRCGDQLLSTTLKFAGRVERLNAFAKIVDASIANNSTGMVTALDEGIAILGGDAALYSVLTDTAKTNLADKLIANTTIDATDKTDITKIVSILDIVNGMVFVEAVNDTKVTVLTPVLEAYLLKGTVAGDNTNKAAADFKNTAKIAEVDRAGVLSAIAGKNFADITALRAAFVEQVVMKGVSRPVSGVTTIKIFISDYAVISGVSALPEYIKYLAYSADNQAKVAKAVNVAKPTTYVQLVAVLKQAVVDIEKAKEGPQGGANGGTNTGSSSSISMPTATPAPTPAPPAASKKVEDFSDSGDANWAKPAMQKMLDDRIWVGDGNNTLRPNDVIVREEAIKMIVNAFCGGVDPNMNSTFTDVKTTDWFYAYVATAQQKGITSGIGNGMFGAGVNIARQDLALMIYNVMLEKGIALDTSDNTPFADDQQISPYAKDAVYAMKNAGLISGYDGIFSPQGSATRAETAQIFANVLKHLGL